MRLEGLGERVAKAAGLKSQDLPALNSGTPPGRGGAASALPARNLDLDELTGLVTSSRTTSTCAGTSSRCWRRCWCRPPPRASSCRRCAPSPTAGTRRTSASASTRFPARAASTRASTSWPRRERPSSRPRAGWSSSRAGTPSMVRCSRSTMATAWCRAMPTRRSSLVGDGDLVVRGQHGRRRRVDRALDGPASALRGPPERCSAEPGAVPRLLQLTGRAVHDDIDRGEAFSSPLFFCRRRGARSDA